VLSQCTSLQYQWSRNSTNAVAIDFAVTAALQLSVQLWCNIGEWCDLCDCKSRAAHDKLSALLKQWILPATTANASNNNSGRSGSKWPTAVRIQAAKLAVKVLDWCRLKNLCDSNRACCAQLCEQVKQLLGTVIAPLTPEKKTVQSSSTATTAATKKSVSSIGGSATKHGVSTIDTYFTAYSKADSNSNSTSAPSSRSPPVTSNGSAWPPFSGNSKSSTSSSSSAKLNFAVKNSTSNSSGKGSFVNGFWNKASPTTAAPPGSNKQVCCI
jgi:hypothetical protein